MKVSGSFGFDCPPERIWRALHDVDLLREALPGCERLDQTAPDTFTGVARVGIAAIKGSYSGTVRLSDEREPEFLRMAVDARSGHAQIKGEGSLSLERTADGTRVEYDGDARVFGPLAAVGQRLVPSAAKLLTERFFKNLAEKLSETVAP